MCVYHGVTHTLGESELERSMCGSNFTTVDRNLRSDTLAHMYMYMCMHVHVHACTCACCIHTECMKVQQMVIQAILRTNIYIHVALVKLAGS